MGIKMSLLPKLPHAVPWFLLCFSSGLQIENVNTNVLLGSLIKHGGDETICPVRFALMGLTVFDRLYFVKSKKKRFV